MPVDQKINFTEVTPLEQAAISFYLDREAAHCTPATLVWYRKYVDALVRYLAARGVRELSQVRSDHLRAYLVAMRATGLSERSVHHHAAAARAFLNFAVNEGLLSDSPMRRVTMPRLPKYIPAAFTAEEGNKLLSACETRREYAAVLFLLDTGLRAAEFVALNIGDVDVSTGAVRVLAGKGRKERVVYIGVRTSKAYLRYLAERSDTGRDAPLWVSEKTGSRLTHWGLRQMLERIGERAGVAGVSPHNFRRTFAIWSLRAGMDLVRLAALMGHADLSMLRRYLAVVEKDLRAAHQNHGAVDTMMRSKGRGQ